MQIHLKEGDLKPQSPQDTTWKIVVEGNIFPGLVSKAHKAPWSKLAAEPGIIHAVLVL